MPPLSKKRVAPSDDESDEAQAPLHSKKARTSEKTSAAAAGGGSRDANGDVFWELSDHRRVTVSEFKGKTMISIREYYEKDRQMLPGKKGITLPVAQFAALVAALPDVESALKGRGEKLPRPNYEAVEKGVSANDDELSDAEKKLQSNREKKRNFEETSEED